MKKLSFTLLLLLFAGVSNAQSYNQKLLKVYQQSELEAIQAADYEKIGVLNYAVDNACYFAEAKGKDYSSLQTIQLSDLTKIPSFVDLGLKIENQNQYFKIAGSDKLLVVKSEIVLQYERKKSLNK